MAETDQTFEKFLTNLKYWLAEEHCLTAKVGEIKDNRVEVELFTEEGEEFYVGSYSDPGLMITWLDHHDFGAAGWRALVEVNGVVFEALGKHIAGWVSGYV